MVCSVVVMVLAWYAVLAYMSTNFAPEVRAAWPAPATDLGMLRAVLLILIELMLITAIALFFSTFSTPILSAALTFGLYLVGHFSADLRNFQDVVDSPAAARLARGLYWVLPNLAQFDVKANVVHGQPVSPGYLAVTIAYGAVYIAMLLAVSAFIFSRRDFK